MSRSVGRDEIARVESQSPGEVWQVWVGCQSVREWFEVEASDAEIERKLRDYTRAQVAEWCPEVTPSEAGDLRAVLVAKLGEYVRSTLNSYQEARRSHPPPGSESEPLVRFSQLKLGAD